MPTKYLAKAAQIIETTKKAHEFGIEITDIKVNMEQINVNKDMLLKKLKNMNEKHTIAEVIIGSGSLMPYPGEELFIGLSSQSVMEIQGQLNTISKYYPAIPKVTEDGIYVPRLEKAVKVFQHTFTLPQTGMVDYATWYKISEICTMPCRFRRVF